MLKTHWSKKHVPYDDMSIAVLPTNKYVYVYQRIKRLNFLQSLQSFFL